MTCRACDRSADLGRQRLLGEIFGVWVRSAARRRPQLSGTADSTVVVSHAAMLQVEEQQRAAAMERAKEEARRAAAQSSLNTPAPWAGSAPQVCVRDRVCVWERPTSITPHPGSGPRRRFVLHTGMMRLYARAASSWSRARQTAQTPEKRRVSDSCLRIGGQRVQCELVFS